MNRGDIIIFNVYLTKKYGCKLNEDGCIMSSLLAGRSTNKNNVVEHVESRHVDHPAYTCQADFCNYNGTQLFTSYVFC